MVSKTNSRKRHVLGTNTKAVVQTTGKYTLYTEHNVPPNYNQAKNKVDSLFWRKAIKATTTMTAIPRASRQNPFGIIETSAIKAIPCSITVGVGQE